MLVEKSMYEAVLVVPPLVRSSVEVILPAGFSSLGLDSEKLQDLSRLKGKLVFKQNGQVIKLLLYVAWI